MDPSSSFFVLLQYHVSLLKPVLDATSFIPSLSKSRTTEKKKRTDFDIDIFTKKDTNFKIVKLSISKSVRFLKNRTDFEIENLTISKLITLTWTSGLH